MMVEPVIGCTDNRSDDIDVAPTSVEMGDDERWMRHAFALAERAERDFDEIPVGAVLVGADGRLLGEGWKLDNIMELIFSSAFVFSVLRLTTPILFATLSSVISERAGIGNITMEGVMLISALTGVIVSTYTQSAGLGSRAPVQPRI